MHPVRVLAATALLLAPLMSVPAIASVALRVESRPVSDPIKAYVAVTDASGHPVSNLTAADFTLLLDGVSVSSATVSQPPSQDPDRRVSVVFVMDFSGSVINVAMADLQQSVIGFINAMQPGDYAAIVKFNARNPDKVSVVQPFTQIDGGAGTSALIGAVMAPYPDGTTSGDGTNLFDGVKLAAEQFGLPTTPLPKGPKAIVVASDGEENASTVSGNVAVDLANNEGVSIFTIGIGNVQSGRPLEILEELAARTGGQYIPAPTATQIEGAYVAISHLLNNEYVLTFASSISDCSAHTLQVQVTGQTTPATATFTRCTAPNPPEDDASGGGGGGSLGTLEVLAGLSLLGLRRRRFNLRTVPGRD